MKTYGIYEGVLDTWCDAGSEGIHWALRCDRKDAQLLYGELLLLEHGDILTIWDAEGTQLFSRRIIADTQRHWRPYPHGVAPLRGLSRLNPFSRMWFLWRRYCVRRWDTLPGWTKRFMRAFLSGQPAVSYAWVPWTAAYVSAERWGGFFFPPQGEGPYRARVFRMS